MKPTTCQQQASEFVRDFLLNPDQSEMCITGSGGVGKTWVAKEALPEVIKDIQAVYTVLGSNKKAVSNIIYTAPTNAAAGLLNGASIHATLGLRLVNDYATGRRKTVTNKDTHPISNSIVVIDEGSMLGTSLKRHLDTYTSNCKRIYLLDPAQLGSVEEGEVLLPTLGLPTIDMHTPVRHGAQTDLHRVCMELRHAVLNNLPYELKPSEDVIFIDSPNDYLRNSDPSKNLTLAYRNKVINAYNTLSRKLKGLPEHFVIGDQVIAANTLGGKEAGSTKSITNNTMYTIKGVDLNQILIDGIPCYCVKLNNNKVVAVPFDVMQMQQTIKRYYSIRDYQKYFHATENIADLRSAVAMTVHKAQGRTVDTVLLNHTDLLYTKQYGTNQDYLRTLYTAVSRARYKVYVRG